jgi:integrase
MASVANDPNGRKRILFVDADENRKAIRLGKIDRKSADAIARHVEALLSAKIGGQPVPRDTAAWQATIGAALHDKLARVGLVHHRQDNGDAPALGPFVDAFLAGRCDLKPNTRVAFIQTRKALVRHFGEDKPILRINAGDADEWAATLRRDYAPATVATFVKKARQMFRHAVRKRLLTESPFASVRVPSQVNKAREEFVSRETIAQVIDAAPGLEWRVIIALARFAGLRTPSETLALQWSYVDWERSRLTIFSPKLEHLPSGGFRAIPLFPELRAILADAFDAAPEGSVYVVNRYRDGRQNLRTQFLRIIRKAGVKPWGRLFHNLRGSLETELAQDHPIHVVAQWLGNTPKVAAAHYLQVRDSDFERALAGGAKSGALEAQKAAQRADAGSGDDSQNVKKTLGNTQRECVIAGNAGETEYPRQESNL